MLQPSILEQMSEQSKKALFVFDLQALKTEYVSASFKQLWPGATPGSGLTLEMLLECISDEDRQRGERLLKNLMQGNRVETELKMPPAGGKKQCLKVEALPIKGENGKVEKIAGWVEDVTRLSSYINFLLEFGIRKNNVLEVVAHDLKGPLAVAQNVLRVLEKDHQLQSYQDFAQHINLVQRACGTCINLIKDLLDVENMRTSEVSLQKEQVNLVAKVEELVNTFRYSHTIPQRIILEAEKDEIIVFADDIKLTQVINNLVGNALKFTDANGVVKIELAEQDSEVLITVTDNGIGIPADLQPYLFDKSSRASRAGLRGEPSTGLGLVIVHELVEAHGGRMWFETEEKVGTSFYISLPKGE